MSHLKVKSSVLKTNVLKGLGYNTQLSPNE